MPFVVALSLSHCCDGRAVGEAFNLTQIEMKYVNENMDEMVHQLIAANATESHGRELWGVRDVCLPQLVKMSGIVVKYAAVAALCSAPGIQEALAKVCVTSFLKARALGEMGKLVFGRAYGAVTSAVNVFNGIVSREAIVAGVQCALGYLLKVLENVLPKWIEVTGRLEIIIFSFVDELANAIAIMLRTGSPWSAVLDILTRLAMHVASCATCNSCDNVAATKGDVTLNFCRSGYEKPNEATECCVVEPYKGCNDTSWSIARADGQPMCCPGKGPNPCSKVIEEMDDTLKLLGAEVTNLDEEVHAQYEKTKTDGQNEVKDQIHEVPSEAQVLTDAPANCCTTKKWYSACWFPVFINWRLGYSNRPTTKKIQGIKYCCPDVSSTDICAIAA